MTRLRRSMPSLVATVVFLLTAGVASATWTAASESGGSGSAAAAAVNRGITPIASPAGSSVTLDWAPSTLSSGDPVSGYVIKRYNATSLTPQTVGDGCAGRIAATSCIESALPPGQWAYSVTPVAGTNWVGAESPLSNIAATDPTPPANAITASAQTGGVFNVGDTVFYRGVAAGSFTLTNAVADSDSGPYSSRTSDLNGDATGWTHTPSTVVAPAGGPYVSQPFLWTAGTTSAPSEAVTGQDAARNSTTTVLTFVDDSTPPTAGTIAYPSGYQPDESVIVTFTSGADSGAGIATRQLQRSAATLDSGVCGAFTAFTDVGPNNPVSPYTDSQVADETCYQYRYGVTDHVGNRDITTNAAVALVAAAAGGPALRTAGPFSVLGGTGVVSTLATTISGDLGVSPSNSVVGFPPGLVAGTIHAGDPIAAHAQLDRARAYADAAARIPNSEFAGDLNGRTFHPGVYHTAAALALTGTVTLDGDGDPNAVFVFQVNAALNTAAGSIVNLIDGAQPSHVFWQVNGAVGTGALSTFAGTILATAAITLGAGTQLIGRALAGGTVTMANNTIRFTSALPPVVTVDGGTAAVTKDTTPTITGTTNAPAGTLLRVIVAGQALTTTVQTDATWSVTATALSAGTYDVVASVRDSAGNAGSATQSITVEVNPNPVLLSSASSFSVLAGVSVVNTGATTVGGDVGVSPSSSVVGFPPGQISGAIHAGDDTAAQAQQSVAAAYADAAGRAPSGEFSGDLNGRTFHAGVYHSTAAMALTGTVTLDGENNPNAVFIFQVDAAANTAAGSIVNLVNGAEASHVFWVVAGAVGTGALSSFSGTIISAGSITLGAGAQLVGRALCDGTVTMAANDVKFGM